jgi:hypothetical protein
MCISRIHIITFASSLLQTDKAASASESPVLMESDSAASASVSPVLMESDSAAGASESPVLMESDSAASASVSPVLMESDSAAGATISRALSQVYPCVVSVNDAVLNQPFLPPVTPTSLVNIDEDLSQGILCFEVTLEKFRHLLGNEFYKTHKRKSFS